MTPPFVWSKSEGTSFELKVAVNGTRLAVVDTIITDATCTPSRVLDRNKIYVWNVLASNTFGSSDWSADSRFRTTDAMLVENTAEVPTKPELSQNYPNPFNPVTTIRFAIPQTGMTRLKVYDLLGREVASLVDEELPPGSYRTQLDTDRLPKGNYFYTLTSGSTRLVKKMILLK